MRANQMQKMEANILRRGHEVLPRVGLLRAEFSPERIDQLKADGDMAHELAAIIVAHGETGLGQSILPKFSAIMKQDAGKQKIDIQLRIERRDLLRDAHHLRGVLDKATAACVMIIARGGGATKPVAPFF